MSLQLTFCILIFLSVSWAIPDCNIAKVNSTIQQLKNKLKCGLGYESDALILKDEKIDINITMDLTYIEYDSYQYKITIHNWMQMYFRDESLAWNPSEYNSIKSVILDGKDLSSIPLIYHRNEFARSVKTSFEFIHCNITFVGGVLCITPIKNEGFCLQNPKYYPFDTLSCSIVMGSDYHMEEVQFRFLDPNNPLTMDTFTPNTEWELINTYARNETEKFFDNENKIFTDHALIYTYNLRRHTGIYYALVIVPAFVLVLVTFSILMMDINSPERVHLCLFNFVFHLLFLQNIHWQTPFSKEKPVIIILFRDSTILSGFLIVLSLFYKNLANFRMKCPNLLSKVASNSFVENIISFTGSVQRAAFVKLGEEDNEIMIEAEVIKKDEKWNIIANFLDFFTSIAYFIVYIILFENFIPKG